MIAVAAVNVTFEAPTLALIVSFTKIPAEDVDTSIFPPETIPFNTIALASVSPTLLPVLIPTDAKSLAELSVISFPAPAAIVVAPVTVNAPL